MEARSGIVSQPLCYYAEVIIGLQTLDFYSLLLKEGVLCMCANSLKSALCGLGMLMFKRVRLPEEGQVFSNC
jgi:hypothetical protein